MILDWSFFAGGRFYNWCEQDGKWVLSRWGKNRKRKRLDRRRMTRASWEARQLLDGRTRDITEAEATQVEGGKRTLMWRSKGR